MERSSWKLRDGGAVTGKIAAAVAKSQAPRSRQLRAHQVAQRGGEFAVERPAGCQHQPPAGRERVDTRGVPRYDRGFGDAETKDGAVLPRHPDFVADHDVGQEREMRVAMRRVDRRAGLAGARRALDMTGTERQRLSAAAVQDDRRLAEARDFDARLRPRIGPG